MIVYFLNGILEDGFSKFWISKILVRINNNESLRETSLRIGFIRTTKYATRIELYVSLCVRQVVVDHDPKTCGYINSNLNV